MLSSDPRSPHIQVTIKRYNFDGKNGLLFSSNAVAFLDRNALLLSDKKNLGQFKLILLSHPWKTRDITAVFMLCIYYIYSYKTKLQLARNVI